MKSITICALAAASLTSALPLQLSQAAAVITTQSDFVMELTMPGATDHLRRPGRVFYDAQADEIFVADESNNRLVVFSSEGGYKFEFALAGRVGAIVDFAVAPSGFVYVLGSTTDGRALLTFDFDGLYIGEFLADPSAFAEMEFTSLTVRNDGRVFLLDTRGQQIVRVSPDGELETRFPLFGKSSENQDTEVITGVLSATGAGILVPLSMSGMVRHYAPDGTILGSYGHQGTTAGELGFPVSAVMDAQGMVCVLDKQRYAVLCYNTDGRCVGEFGGRGRTAGWFYYPSFLEVDGTGRLIISQIFHNRVQICRVPASIRAAFEQGGAVNSGESFRDKTEIKDLVNHIQHFSTQGGL